MSYYNGRTVEGRTLDDVINKYLPIDDMPFCWQNLNDITSEHLYLPIDDVPFCWQNLNDITSEHLYLPIDDMPFCWQNLNDITSENLFTTEPYLHELRSYRQHCNSFILSPINQDNPSLLQDATDLILPSSCFTNLADIPSLSSAFSINMELSPLPFTEGCPQTRDSLLLPQEIQNQEPSTKKFASLLPNAGLSYKLGHNAHLQNPIHRALEVPRGISLDGFDSHVVMGSLLQSTAEQVDAQSETVNQILATSETHNMNEINRANREAKKFQSPFELSSTYRVEVAKTRMRWTPELHEYFVQAVNHFGGPDRTTPRSILIKMGVDGLTLDQVKSHLQKYRLARHQPEAKEDKRASCSEGKKRNSNEKDNKVSKVSTKESATLHTQWELQKALHDQLKIIRELQLQAKENGRQLQEFMENQNKMQEAFMRATQSLSSTSKVNNAEDPSTQECTSEDDNHPKHHHSGENCLLESNVLPFHKKARLDT